MNLKPPLQSLCVSQRVSLGFTRCALAALLFVAVSLGPGQLRAEGTWDDANGQVIGTPSSSVAGPFTRATITIVDPIDGNNSTTVHYPAELESINSTLYVIGWGNGIGTLGGDNYPEYFDMLVSYGFVVAACHSPTVNSDLILASVQAAMVENNNPESPLFGKLETQFAVMGKSGGAIAASIAVSQSSDAIAAVMIAGSQSEPPVSDPALFLTGTEDYLQAGVQSGYDAAIGPAIYAVQVGAYHSPPPEGRPPSNNFGFPNLSSSEPVSMLATSFLRHHLRGDPDTLAYITDVDSLNETSTWAEYTAKNYADTPPPNAAPTDIVLSTTTVDDGQAAGLVATLSTVDPDAEDTFTYALVSGDGDTDNASFSISGNELYSSVGFDFAGQSTYQLRVSTTEQGGLSYAKSFTITVSEGVVTPPNGYPIEETYETAGAFDVLQTEIQDYQIFYPSELTSDHPVITWGNSAGAVPGMFRALLEHFASWGFVVVATNTQASSPELLIEGVDLIDSLNSDESSIFFGKLRMDKVAAAGHSLGGAAAVGAAINDPRIQVVCSGNPGVITSTESSEIKTLVMTGTEDFWLGPTLESFSTFNGSIVLGILDGAPHFGFMGNGGSMRGYATAWLMAQMQGDAYANGAFYGDAEMANHEDWEVQYKEYDPGLAPLGDFADYAADPQYGLDPSEQGFADDPDMDGMENGLEAWFGTHPGEANIQQVVFIAEGDLLSFTHPQSETPPADMRIRYEWTLDLQAWYEGNGIDGPTTEQGLGTQQTVIMSPSTSGSTTTVTVTPENPVSKLFTRSVVEQVN